jgi:hypothetical protein
MYRSVRLRKEGGGPACEKATASKQRSRILRVVRPGASIQTSKAKKEAPVRGSNGTLQGLLSLLESELLQREMRLWSDYMRPELVATHGWESSHCREGSDHAGSSLTGNQGSVDAPEAAGIKIARRIA